MELGRLQNTEKQLSHPQQQQPKHSSKQRANYLSPSLTPQAPNRPCHTHTSSGAINTQNTITVTNSLDPQGHLDEKRLNVKNSGHSATRAGANTLANSLIHGRKVDSPKIFVKEFNDRPKTSAQQIRKSKGTKAEPRKKSKNLNQTMISSGGKAAFKATPKSISSGLNTTLTNGTTIQAPVPKKLKGTLINLGPQTNKEISSRKFDFVLTQQMASTKHSKEMQSGASKKRPQASMLKMKSNKVHMENRTKNKSFDL